MIDQSAASDDSFNPATLSRGMTEPSKEKDKAGRGNKTPVHGVRLTLADGSCMSLRNCLITGHPWMNPEHTVIEIPIQGRVKLEGEWKPNADYLVTVTGRNLEVIFDQVSEDKRVSIHKSVAAEGKEPQVDLVEVEELPD
jgi:hypothetical protein